MNLYHARPAHHVDWLGDLPALLVPDLLRLPALRLHCLEGGGTCESKKGRKGFCSHGVALSQQYMKARREGQGTGEKGFTHMEWYFLRLVLALLPEGMLAVVSHNFVLETGF